MKILEEDGWVLVSSAGGDVSFQKSSAKNQLRLKYTSGSEPTEDDGSFRVADNEWRLLPAIEGKSSLYASAFQGEVTIAIEDIAQ